MLSTADTKAEHYVLTGAYRRLQRAILVLFTAGLIPAWNHGRAFTEGFIFGSLLAFINFVWLKQSISTFLDKATARVGVQSSFGVLGRFFLRFVLLAAAIAYATINGSNVSIYGLIAGLSLVVWALFFEAAYEIFRLS